VPIYEANRPKSRDRYPLAFDLEGVPRETVERERRLLAAQLVEQRNLDSQSDEGEFMPPVNNSFAVDYAAGNNVVDINNPPQKRYVHQEFPKMVYHHDSGHVLEVKTTAELKAALKKGFNEKPAPDRDYHLAKAGRVAPMKQVVEPREVDLSLDDAVDAAADDEVEETPHFGEVAEDDSAEESRPRRGRSR
jgi:hypothetical protein